MTGNVEHFIPVWKKATEALFAASNPVPAKILLEKKGVISSATVRPPLALADLPDSSILKEADLAIAEWYKTYNV